MGLKSSTLTPNSSTCGSNIKVRFNCSFQWFMLAISPLFEETSVLQDLSRQLLEQKGPWLSAGDFN